MTNFTLPISLMTNVEIGYQPPLLSGDAFGRGLIVGNSQNNRAAPNQLYGIYTTLDAVKADYNEQASEYQIAKQYFAQSPRPKDVMIATVMPQALQQNLTAFSCAGADFQVSFADSNLTPASNVRIQAVISVTDQVTHYDYEINLGTSYTNNPMPNLGSLEDLNNKLMWAFEGTALLFSMGMGALPGMQIRFQITKLDGSALTANIKNLMGENYIAGQVENGVATACIGFPSIGG